MKKIDKSVIKLLVSFLLFIVSFFLGDYQGIGFFLSYLVIAYEMYFDAFAHMKEKDFFDENFLMIIASIGAFIIGEYIEAVLVIWLFQLGEYLSDLAVDHSKDSILKLLSEKVDVVHVKRGTGYEDIKVEEVKVGDIIGIKPGEKIPVDGILKKGDCLLDTSSVTGESVPRTVEISEPIFSGCVSINAFIEMEVTHTYENSLTYKIISLMNESGKRKADTEKFITKFSKIYTPVIVILALLLVLIPTLLGYSFDEYLYKALVFLVTSCPCALVLSIPLGYFCGIGACSKQGIYIKGGKELENLSHIDTICFDKTGTLTKGSFEVQEIVTNMEKEEFLKMMAYAEYYSNHPIASSIVKRYGREIEEQKISEFKEVAGKGVICFYGKKQLCAGNQAWMLEHHISVPLDKQDGSIVYLGIDGEYAGYATVADSLKEDAQTFIQKANRYFKLVLLSGDRKENIATVAKDLGIKEYYAELLPTDKVKVIESFKEKVLFVGDGMNDAPVMASAFVSMAMSKGSDIAINSSDIVLLNNHLMDIDTSYQIAARTMRILRFNIVFCLTIKFLMLILGLFGITSILGAVFADVGVTLLSVLNTLRIFYKKSV